MHGVYVKHHYIHTLCVHTHPVYTYTPCIHLHTLCIHTPLVYTYTPYRYIHHPMQKHHPMQTHHLIETHHPTRTHHLPSLFTPRRTQYMIFQSTCAFCQCACSSMVCGEVWVVHQPCGDAMRGGVCVRCMHVCEVYAGDEHSITHQAHQRWFATYNPSPINNHNITPP